VSRFISATQYTPDPPWLWAGFYDFGCGRPQTDWARGSLLGRQLLTAV